MATIQCQSCGYVNPSEARFCANCGSNLAATIEQTAPTIVPSATPAPEIAVEYTGFWRRLLGALIDGLIVIGWLSILGPLQYIFIHITPLVFFPYIIVILYFWLFIGLKGQTLGKMVVGIKVVNAEGSIPGLGDAALREVPGKIVSSIVIYLGFLWIIWDRQKQGWHDKIASTHVVRVESRR